MTILYGFGVVLGVVLLVLFILKMIGGTRRVSQSTESIQLKLTDWEEKPVAGLVMGCVSLALLALVVWAFSPDSFTAFVKKYSSLEVSLGVMVVSFLLAKKQVDAINVWTLPLAMFILTLVGSTLLFIVKFFQLVIFS